MNFKFEEDHFEILGLNQELVSIGGMLVKDFIKKVEDTMITITVKLPFLEKLFNNRVGQQNNK